MSRYNPFFEKAGMRKIMERFTDHEITEAIEQLSHVEFEPKLLSSIRYNLEKLKNMKPTEIMKCREILARASESTPPQICGLSRPIRKECPISEYGGKSLIRKACKNSEGTELPSSNKSLHAMEKYRLFMTKVMIL